MTDFDWRTDEAADAFDNGPSPAKSTRRRRRPLLFFGFIMLVAILTSVAYRVRQRVAAINEMEVAAVRQVMMLAHESATAGDLEVFAQLLAPGDDAWRQAMIAAVAEQRWLDKPSLFLERAAAAPESVGVAMDADLRGAWVTLTHDYTNFVGESLQLEQRLRLRHVAGGWYLAPFPATAREIRQAEVIIPAGTVSLTFSYPAADATASIQLLTDLADVIHALCAAEAGLASCQPALIELIATAELPAPLGATPQRQPPASDPYRAYIPSGARTGTPASAESETLLHNALLELSLYEVMPALLPDSCCRALAVHRAVAAHIVAAAPTAAPVAPERLETLLFHDASGSDLQRIAWSSPAPPTAEDVAAATIAVHYLARYSDAPPLAWLHDVNQHTSLRSWLDALASTPDRPPYHHFTAQLWAAQQTAVATPPVGLTTVCTRDEAAALLRFDPTTVRWEPAWRDQPVENRRILAAPNRLSALIYTAGSSTATTSALYRWQSDTLTPLARFDGLITVEPSAPPDGSLRFVRQFGPMGEYRSEILDLTECSGDRCTARHLDGTPHWSPDGRRTAWVVTTLDANQEKVQTLYLGNASAQQAQPLATVRNSTHAVLSHFWPDSSHIATVESVASADSQTRATQVRLWTLAGQDTTVLRSADIENHLGRPPADSPPTIIWLGVSDDRWLFAALQDDAYRAGQIERSTLLALSPADGTLTTLIEGDGAMVIRPLADTAPFIVVSRGPNQAETAVIDRDGDVRLTLEAPVYAAHIAPDGQWLALFGYNRYDLVDLYSPSADVRLRTFLPEGASCTSAAWLRE